MIGKLYFIHHSCYLWESGEQLLLFDYAGAGDVLPLLSNAPQKPLYLLNSHSHSDHYTPAIFETFSHHPAGCHYLFHEELRDAAPYPGITFLKTGESCTFGDLTVKAYGSTDVGGSFYCRLHGFRIFHAGDLNNWHWNEEADDKHIALYEQAWQKELDRLTSEVDALDLLMFPTDLRLGRDYLKGLKELLDKVSVKYLAPMHINGTLVPNELENLAQTHHFTLLMPTPNKARNLTIANGK